MLDLLRKFEDESAEDAEALEEEEDEFDLAKRFASVDLDSANPDAIWEILSPSEREKFLRTLQDPNSEGAKELLASEGVRRNIREPWWEGQYSRDVREEAEDGPAMMSIPASMLKPMPNRPLLVYNLAAICIAYTFVVRRLGVASFSDKLCDRADLEIAIELLSSLVPFLTDRKSTLVRTSLPGTLTDLCSRFGDENAPSPGLLSALLHDSALLMTPLDVMEHLGSPDNTLGLHPHRRLLLVLSDISQLFSLGHVPQQSKHVTHKLVFYCAHTATMPTPLLRTVAAELGAKSVVLSEEAQAQRHDVTGGVPRNPSRKPIVEEV